MHTTVDEKIDQWFKDRGIVENGKTMSQAIKTLEETTELIDAINKKYLEIEKTKMISDEEIMQKFSDTIWIPTYITNNFSSKLFNLILKKLSKKARIKMKLNV